MPFIDKSSSCHTEEQSVTDIQPEHPLSKVITGISYRKTQAVTSPKTPKPI
ncbi:hypothetical protein DPMN_023777 [Dreissena polymorpha]|uniref:Uncharacterized protein n=1 Tax=Dreissena polymorpha TaxID=45954 RepID=A0A9D4LN50_DREPO|nr:hypothetical protein DPMN_023777 [Dreissena polymorpha]